VCSKCAPRARYTGSRSYRGPFPPARGARARAAYVCKRPRRSAAIIMRMLQRGARAAAAPPPGLRSLSRVGSLRCLRRTLFEVGGFPWRRATSTSALVLYFSEEGAGAGAAAFLCITYKGSYYSTS
jgi:hypothetical protein